MYTFRTFFSLQLLCQLCLFNYQITILFKNNVSCDIYTYVCVYAVYVYCIISCSMMTHMCHIIVCYSIIISIVLVELQYVYPAESPV